MADNFTHWGCAPCEAEEWSVSSAKTRDEIIDEARAHFGDTFVIGQFGPPDISKFSINAEELIENAMDGAGPAADSIASEIGENGEHGLEGLSPHAMSDLQEVLDAACRHWVSRHQICGYFLTGPYNVEQFCRDTGEPHG